MLFSLFPSAGVGSASTTELLYSNAGALDGISGWTTNGTTALTGGASTTLAIGGAAIGPHTVAIAGTVSISSILNADSMRSGPSGYSVWSTSPGVGTPKVAFDQVSAGTAGIIYVSSDSIIGFNSATTLASGAVDGAFSRISAGVIGVGTGAAGSTAGGLQAATIALSSYLQSPVRVVADADGAAITASDSNTLYTNEGATAQANFTLPTAVAGLVFSGYCQDADGIKLTAAAGDTIRIEGTVSAAAGNIVSTTIGSFVKLVAINATEWVAVSAGGTWVVT